MDIKRGIVWFRQDLRLEDNEAITEATQHCEEVLFVYVFDERQLKGKTHVYGFPKTGIHRTRFLLESVEDLRKQVRAIGGELIIRFGKPEEEVFAIAQQLKSSWVFCNRERTPEEQFVQDALEQNLWTVGQEIRFSRGKMLYYTSDLPFPITQTPDAFSQFKKEVEKLVQVRLPLPVPSKCRFVKPLIEIGELPTLEDLGWSQKLINELPTSCIRGGNSAGIAHMKSLFGESNWLKRYKDNRNSLLTEEATSRISAWLALGCVSPKMVYYALKDHEAQYGANDSTHAFMMELLFRDYLRLIGKKFGVAIFEEAGPKGAINAESELNETVFTEWADGKTGVPIIDAFMTQLRRTGYINHKGRQLVASYLVKELAQPWRMGAEYFESILIDYDVTSNWGNWNMLAGVGVDTKEEKSFNPITFTERFDSNGAYVQQWLSPLSQM